MQIGYARVSTADQTTDPQRRALEGAGCADIFEDTASGAHAKREGLQAALDRLQTGDVLAVWKLDRLGRSLQDLLQIVGRIEAKGAGLRSLTEEINTTSSGGRLVFHIFAALAEFERGLIVERTQAGLQAAKRRGAKLGRRAALTAEQVRHAEILIQSGQGADRAAYSLGVHPATLRRHRAKTRRQSGV
jgi:DNA invertase Pin-like site-specific DNA recombinase